ncbi:L-dopachrome tautomerase-related protein [Bradyrhizobium sp. USDA 4454]
MKIISSRRILFCLATALMLAILGPLAFVKIEYGRGTPYPDIGSDNPEGLAKLEKLITLDYPPGNVAVANDGHVYFNYHPIARAGRFSPNTVFEWADGKITPFPSKEMQKEFQGSFGMTIDNQNRIWLIEPASFDFRHTRLWAFDLATRKRVDYFEFPGKDARFAQDLRVTADGKYIVLADTGIMRFTAPKLIVYSVADHTYRTALGAHLCTSPEDWLMQTPFGAYRLGFGLVNVAVGLDGIEISPDQQWVYLAGMTNSHLCRVPLSAVLDPTIAPSDVASKVEDLGRKPLSDGITTDRTGDVILTGVEHGGLMAFDLNTRKARTLVRSRDVIWPDGVVTGPDDSLYFTDSALSAYMGQLAGPPDQAQLAAHRPYFIYRLKR